MDGRTNSRRRTTWSRSPRRTAGAADVADNFPQYLVPSQTTSITARPPRDGTEPIQFDMSTPAGDPDVASGQGLDVTATAIGNPLTAGEWSVAPDRRRTVRTRRGHHREHPHVDDGHHRGVRPGRLRQYRRPVAAGHRGPFTVTPVVVQPGHSATIPVTIAPTGPGKHRVGRRSTSTTTACCCSGSWCPTPTPSPPSRTGTRSVATDPHDVGRNGPRVLSTRGPSSYGHTSGVIGPAGISTSCAPATTTTPRTASGSAT